MKSSLSDFTPGCQLSGALSQERTQGQVQLPILGYKPLVAHSFEKEKGGAHLAGGGRPLTLIKKTTSEVCCHLRGDMVQLKGPPRSHKPPTSSTHTAPHLCCFK